MVRRIYLLAAVIVLLGVLITLHANPACPGSRPAQPVRILLLMAGILAAGYGLLFYLLKKFRDEIWLKVDSEGLLWHYLNKQVTVRWDQVREVRFGKGPWSWPNAEAIVVKTDAGRMWLTLKMVDRGNPLPEIAFRWLKRGYQLKQADGTLVEATPETSEVLAALKAHLPAERFQQGWFLL